MPERERTEPAQALPPRPGETGLARLATQSASWFEHWFPDAFAFAVLTVAIVFGLGLLGGRSPAQMAGYFGDGLWKLSEFTMQMVMIIVTGHALAMAPPVRRAIDALAAHLGGGRRAVAWVALFSMLSSLLSWSFSLLFSGLLARAVARRRGDVDYRALGAAAYLGLGSIWALGASSSAALLMATWAPARQDLLKVSGLLPFSQTVLSLQSLCMALVLLLASVLVAWATTPVGAEVRTAAECGVNLEDLEPEDAEVVAQTPAQKLEDSPVLTCIVVGLGGLFLVGHLSAHGLAAVLGLPIYILVFLLAGMLLHWRPRSYVRAIVAASPAAAGLLLQYPLYAGAAQMLTESGVSARLAELILSCSTRDSFPLLVAIYSAVLGLFIPSAGGKWLIEAQYLMTAANSLHAHLGWVVQTYNAAEALPNLIHPFWMLPLLGTLRLQAKDVVGYTAVQLLVHVPLVLFLVWALHLTMPYVPPLPLPTS